MANYADLRLRTPCTIILSGPSQCGKTTLIEKLLNEDDCFDRLFTEICWVHAPLAGDKQLFDRLGKKLPIVFREGYPETEIIQNTLFVGDKNSPKLLILDDILTGPTTCKSLFDLFNIISHHQNITIILTVQNLHGSTTAQKSCLSTLLRSCSYLILFSSRRMLPVFRFISSCFFLGEQNRVLTPFKETFQDRYSYFVFDFITDNEDLRIRQGGLVPSHRCFVYKDEEDGNIPKTSEK
jgi:hypothetical protein